MGEEIWIKIKDSNLYEVSNHSRFRTSFFKGEKRIMKQHISKTGYYSLRIKGKTIKSHRVIAEYFIPNPLNLPQVNHIDGNKLNNNISNLEWVTNKQNSDHAFRIGLIPKCVGEDQSGTILTEKQVLFISKSTHTDKELAAIYNVHHTTINNIRCGKTWAWLTGIKRKTRIYVDRDKVLSMYNSKGTDTEIANKFNVDRRYVNTIKKGYRYSDITGVEYKRKAKERIEITKDLILSIFNSKEKTGIVAAKFNVGSSFVYKIRNHKIHTNITSI